MRLRIVSLVLGGLISPILIVALPSVGVAATCPDSGGVAVPAATASGEVVFSGHGSGQQIGMSQSGAEGAALLGCTFDQILKRYYTDSVLTAAGPLPPNPTPPAPRRVQLRMLDNGTFADSLAETANVTWQLSGCTLNCPPSQPMGSTWRLRLDAAQTGYELVDLAKPATPKWTGGSAAQTLRLSHSGRVVRLTTYKGAVVADRRLKWDFATFSIDAKTLDVVQTIDSSAAGDALEKYLWGVDQIAATFPHEALKAQAVVARSYAAKRVGTVLALGEQNYQGYAKESAGPSGTHGMLWKAAVDATAGRVLTTVGGAYFDTVYATSFGGQSEDRRYVHGGLTVPQLQPVDDSRWEMASNNPSADRSWARAFTREQVAQALGVDLLTSVTVTAPGSLARLEGVRVVGVKAGASVNKLMTGWAVKQALKLPSPGFTVTINGIFGAGATPVSGDWNGDGRTDIGWFRDGTWSLRNADGSLHQFTFGGLGDVPVVGDWNGDRKDTVGVFRAGHWSLRNENTAGLANIDFNFGAPGDQPLAGDWNSNVKDGIGVFRQGAWYLRNALSTGPSRHKFLFGNPGDVPVVGDWNGNIKDGIGVYRGGRWYLRNALSTGAPRYGLSYGGVPGDRAVIGDWAGDRRDGVGIVRGADWFLRNSLYAGGSRTRLSFTG